MEQIKPYSSKEKIYPSYHDYKILARNLPPEQFSKEKIGQLQLNDKYSQVGLQWRE